MTAYDIGYLSPYGDAYTVDNYTVSNSSNTNYSTDVFEFDLYYTSNINVALDPSYGDADITLYFDSNYNGYLDAYDQYVAGSYYGSTHDDSINVADQGPGTYFAQVSYYSSSYGYVYYDLDIEASPAYSSTTPTDLLPTEYYVGNLNYDQTYYGWVGNSDTTDTYYFSLDLYEAVDISLYGLTADADIRLIADYNSNGIVDAGEEVSRSQYGGTTSEFISEDLSGDYFLQVYQYSGSTNYTLNFDHYYTTYA